MSGKNLPGGLIQVKDNGDGTLCYVFDKFCIFEKGYINSIYNPLGTLSKPSNTVPVFNYGTTGGILFDFVDNNGNSITVNQALVTGKYALTFPAINTNDTLVTTSLAQTLYNKTLYAPIFNGTSPEFTTTAIFTGSPVAMQFGSGSNIVNINPVIGSAGVINLTLPGNGTALITDTAIQTLSNKTLTSPVFSGTSSGLIQNSSQYSFEAYNSVGQTDVTGSGTDYTVIYDTIEYQVGTGYDSSTGVFTAPIAGKYLFVSCIASQGYSSNTYYYQYFTINGANNYLVEAGVSSSTNGYIYKTISKVINLAANGTVSVGFAVGGNSSNNVSLISGASSTWFQGYLLVNS